MPQIVIAGAKRTPIGSFLGQFKSISATDLGSRFAMAKSASSGESN